MTAHRTTPDVPAAAEPRRNILLADDEETSRRVLGANLSAAGFEVWTAADGLEALRMIESSPPDLLVLDFEMPGLSGVELCRRLRSSEREAIRQLPVIMLTGHGGETEEVACLEAGVNDYVTKPVGREVLIARIETQLRLGALSDALRAQNTELARWRADHEADLEVASATQRAIIGATPPDVENWTIDVLYSPVIQVGGDAYGWRQLSNRRWLFWLADATGHGVGAALFTVLVSWLFNRAAVVSRTAEEILSTVNAEFCSASRSKSFMTACCAVIDPDGSLSFAGAGHPPLLIRRKDGTVETMSSHGTMLGIGKGMVLPRMEARLNPGDLALLYTDGLFSMRTREGERFGHQAVAEALGQVSAERGFLPGLSETLRSHAGAEKFEDDVAAIALVRAG